MVKLKFIDGKPQEGHDKFSAINIVAGYDGCGAYRMLWPAHAVNMNKLGTVIDTNFLDFSTPTFLMHHDAFRFQRQVTKAQRDVFDKLLDFKNKMRSNCRFIYEVDDIFVEKDIPNYNGAKKQFVDGYDLESAVHIIRNCDEMSVTCKYMKDYFVNLTGKKEITVLPNFLPQWWIGGYYDEDRVELNYVKNKNKPRILYAGSPTHVNPPNAEKRSDDFSHIVNFIKKTIDKYQWVFVGAIPNELQELHKSGKVEFAGWVNILDFPSKIWELRVNAVIAPLVDNHFNRAKSNIKLTESGAFGLPGAFQNLDPYKDAPYQFKGADELGDQLKTILTDENTYFKASKDAWAYSSKFFFSVPENLKAVIELYKTPFNGYRPCLEKWKNL